MLHRREVVPWEKWSPTLVSAGLSPPIVNGWPGGYRQSKFRRRCTVRMGRFSREWMRRFSGVMAKVHHSEGLTRA